MSREVGKKNLSIVGKAVISTIAGMAIQLAKKAWDGPTQRHVSLSHFGL